MTQSQVIHIENIGPVLLERSVRARRMTITIRARKDIRVAIPSRMSFKQALEFVHQKAAWIRKALSRLQQIEGRQQVLAELFSHIDEIKAKQTLIGRLRELADKHGFSYNRVVIRNQKTRWGSCSSKSNISLNIKLVVLPQELVDYVILHELVHTRIHNHSKRFWGELNRHAEDSKALASRLREYDLRLL